MILLSLLYEKDLYGYEINSIIEERKMKNWTKIGFSSIYKALNVLEKKKIIESRYEKQFGSPKRKIYYIKDSEKEFVHEMIIEALKSSESNYNNFSIGMAFSNLLTTEEIYEAIEEHKKGLEERRNNIIKCYSEQKQIHNTIHIKALFTYSLKLIDAELEWIKDFIKEVKEEKNDY